MTSKRWQALVKKDAVSEQDADEKASDAESKQAAVVAAQRHPAADGAGGFQAYRRALRRCWSLARETDVGALINAGGGTGPELFPRRRCSPRMRMLCPRAAGFVGRPHRRPDGRAQPAAAPEPSDPGHGDNDIARHQPVVAHFAGRTAGRNNPTGDLQPGTYAEVHFNLPDSPDTLRLQASALLFREDGLKVCNPGPGRQKDRAEIGHDRTRPGH